MAAYRNLLLTELFKCNDDDDLEGKHPAQLTNDDVAFQEGLEILQQPVVQVPLPGGYMHSD
ncbi:hypothetical protein M5K25_023024 [Dendrobium thyrsiflorum]|uniref:Uncharacterized protein n=1 Tax=Dendrobium thyrsiflorum TaxID=117978 RepID=A0ABD0U796_DENTH